MAEQRDVLGGLQRGFVLALLLIFVLLAVPLRSYRAAAHHHERHPVRDHRRRLEPPPRRVDDVDVRTGRGDRRPGPTSYMILDDFGRAPAPDARAT